MRNARWRVRLLECIVRLCAGPKEGKAMLLLNNRGAIDGALRLAAVRCMRRGCQVGLYFALKIIFQTVNNFLTLEYTR